MHFIGGERINFFNYRGFKHQLMCFQGGGGGQISNYGWLNKNIININRKHRYLVYFQLKKGDIYGGYQRKQAYML